MHNVTFLYQLWIALMEMKDRDANASSAGMDMNKGLQSKCLPMGGQEIGKTGL